MYNERELLMHHRQLLDTKSAAADLRLLELAAPRHPKLTEFRLAPERCADDILLELLKVTDRDSIVMNRLRANAAPKKEEAPAGEPLGTRTTEETEAATKTEAAPEAETAAPEAKAAPAAAAAPTPSKKKTAGSKKKTNTHG